MHEFGKEIQKEITWLIPFKDVKKRSKEVLKNAYSDSRNA